MKLIIFLFLFSIAAISQDEVKLNSGIENMPTLDELEKIHEEVIKQMPLTSDRWKINEEYLTIVRDPIEHISINEDCHPLEEKKCELSTALKKYLSIEVTDEVKTLFSENQDIRPGKIVCTELLGGIISLGKKPIRGRFPRYEEFCQFGDGSLITISSLGFYRGMEKIRFDDNFVGEDAKGSDAELGNQNKE